MALILKNCRYVVSQNDSRDILEHVDIVIEKNKISSLSNTKITSKYQVIDCSHNIIMPGLINMHTHLGMTFLRGLAEDMELMEWLEKKVFPEERKLRDHEVYNWTYHGATEAIRFGTTCLVDAYFFPFSIAKALEDIGIRAFIGSDIQEIKTCHANDAEDGLKLSELFIKGYADNNLIIPMAYAHSLYTCSKDTLLKVKKLSEKYKMPFCMHLAETRYEVDYSVKKYGLFPVSAASKLGLCKSNTIFAHCNWMTKDEIQLLNGSTIVHNPISNMKLASGSTLPIPELINAKVNVCLGTDSVASNNNLDMFEEMKVSGLLQKYHRWDTKALPSQQILDMATRNAGIALKKKIGVIAKGYLADIIILEAKEHMMPLDKFRIVNNLVYSAKGSDVIMAIIDGEIRYDRKLIPKNPIYENKVV